MKRLTLLVCTVFVMGLVLGQVTGVMAAGKTHQMTGEVVSVDVEGKMLTFKDAKGESKTAPVLGRAAERLKTLKAGEKVTLTCSDNEKGEHQGISAIRLAQAKKK